MLTNRVVGADGKLAVLPDGSDQQRQQLLTEEISFTDDGRINFVANPTVVFHLLL